MMKFLFTLLVFAFCSTGAVASTDVGFVPTVEKAALLGVEAQADAGIKRTGSAALLGVDTKDYTALDGVGFIGEDGGRPLKWPWNPPPVPANTDTELTCNPCLALNERIRWQPG